MRVTLREIARRAGVHYATASHILNGARGSTHVSDATRRRVLEVAETLGYSANRAAQSLRTRRSRVVGLLTGGLENAFFGRMVSICSEALEARGYDIILATRRRDEASDLHLLETLLTRHLDGILVWSETDTEARERLERENRLPITVMGLESRHHDTVDVALEEGVCEALDHLHAQGFRRIAYLAPRMALNRPGDPRHHYYRRKMVEYGLPERIITYDGSAYTVSAARARAEQFAEEWKMLPEGERPDAIFCLNDMVAFGVLMGLRRRGLRIPDDIALVGCDDLPLSAELDVPLTTIAYPVNELCRRAVDLLLERIEAQTTEETAPVPIRYVPLEARLVVRESTMRTSDITQTTR
jgi:LacI family transcriptional regulator